MSLILWTTIVRWVWFPELPFGWWVWLSALLLAEELDSLNYHWRMSLIVWTPIGWWETVYVLMNEVLVIPSCLWLSRYSLVSGFGLSLSSPSSPMSTPSSHITGIPDFLRNNNAFFLLLQDERSIGGWDAMRIFDLHNSKARYELKVILLHLRRVNVKTTGGFSNIPLADFLYHIWTCAVIILRCWSR